MLDPLDIEGSVGERWAALCHYDEKGLRCYGDALLQFVAFVLSQELYFLTKNYRVVRAASSGAETEKEAEMRFLLPFSSFLDAKTMTTQSDAFSTWE